MWAVSTRHLSTSNFVPPFHVHLGYYPKSSRVFCNYRKYHLGLLQILAVRNLMADSFYLIASVCNAGPPELVTQGPF